MIEDGCSYHHRPMVGVALSDSRSRVARTRLRILDGVVEVSGCGFVSGLRVGGICGRILDWYGVI